MTRHILGLPLNSCEVSVTIYEVLEIFMFEIVNAHTHRHTHTPTPAGVSSYKLISEPSAQVS